MPFTFGTTAITDVKLGTTQVKAVMLRGVQVWPKPSSWQKTFIDEEHHMFGGWMPTPPDLSSMPNPVKGSLIFCMYMQAGSVTLAVIVFDGTQWVESSNSLGGKWCVDLLGSSEYAQGKWFNTPTSATDYDNWVMDPNAGAISGKCYVSAYAAPDGIHIKILDKDGYNPTNFVEPYPLGVTQADLPPSQDFT